MNYIEKNKTNILDILELSEKWLIPNIYKWLAKQTRKLKSQAKKILLSNYLKVFEINKLSTNKNNSDNNNKKSEWWKIIDFKEI